MAAGIQFFSAVLLYSRQPEQLAAFYRDRLGFPLKDEKHGDTDLHYGCELGDVHFAIHRDTNVQTPGSGGNVRMAFTVFDMDQFVADVRAAGVNLLYEPTNVGFAMMTALLDPDGNHVEFTQLSQRWLDHLKSRRDAGHDLFQALQAHQTR